jgi:hypothetical protein
MLCPLRNPVLLPEGRAAGPLGPAHVGKPHLDKHDNSHSAAPWEGVGTLEPLSGWPTTVIGGLLMRPHVLAIAAAAALFAFPLSASSQSIEVGPGGVRIGEGRGRGGGGRCEELRLACEMKDRLGERGEGNCRRYRETCQRPSRREVCQELRSACLQKERLGERGEGNCRRYRETCR